MFWFVCLFHTAYQEIPIDVLKFLEKVNGPTWSCDLCLNKFLEINKIVNGQIKYLFDEIKRSFSDLHTDILESANGKIKEIKITV